MKVRLAVRVERSPSRVASIDRRFGRTSARLVSRLAHRITVRDAVAVEMRRNLARGLEDMPGVDTSNVVDAAIQTREEVMSQSGSTEKGHYPSSRAEGRGPRADRGRVLSTRSGRFPPSGPTVCCVAKHEIEMAVPAQSVKNKDVEVSVRSNGAPLGRVKVSKGTIDWLPSPNSKTHYRLTWEQFDVVMREHGKESS
jgi:hypothetical protein